MQATIFGFIRRYSWRQQLRILLLTLISFPFLYLSLELPKTIINEALGGERTEFVVLGVEMDQFGYLMTLSGLFLALVLVNGGFKYVVNVYKGIVAERMLRRLRYMLYSHVLRFPPSQFKRISQGELVQMINAEVEPLGGYMGDALAVPAFQGGTLLTILFFMFMQDPILGFAAIFLYPLQIYIIPKLQRQVNALGKRRVRQVRLISDRIGETAVAVRDIRANDATQYERARMTHELGVVFDIRFEIYKKKFFIKFLNNFLAQLGPFFFFSLGGWLVLRGDVTLGALVAVLNAHKDLSAPWKELLTHYQLLQDVRIKYEQVVTQFVPHGLIEPEKQEAEPETVPAFDRQLRGTGLTYVDDEDETRLENVSFEVGLPVHLAIVGPAGSGREELLLMLAGLIAPSRGRVLIDDEDIHQLPEAVMGRYTAFVGNPSGILGGTIRDNLLYGLRHRPLDRETHEAIAEEAKEASIVQLGRARIDDKEVEEAADRERKRRIKEAKLSGNSPYDSHADWTDFGAVGLDSEPRRQLSRMVEVLRCVRLEADVYAMGLRGSISQERHPELARRLLEARHTMQERLSGDARLARLVEPFDPERYNSNASLAENLLFGTPVDSTFDFENLAEHPFVRRTLQATNLTEELVLVGYRMAATMVELFADLPPDHDYFQQFSFIDPEALPEFRVLVSRGDPNDLSRLSQDDRERLLGLPFKLIPARHRLGLLEDDLRHRVLEARRYFRQNLPDELRDSIAFFDPEHYNEAASVQENVLFGKIAYGQAQAANRVGALVSEILGELDLHEPVVAVGLENQVGSAGSRLTGAQRQKLAIARALFKEPRILYCYDAIAPLDATDQVPVRDAIMAEMKGRTLIWGLQNPDWAELFEEALFLEHGRLVEHRKGSRDETDTDEEAEEKQVEAAE